ncbi:hypothetical protein [Conexibacter woesei]|uniref:Uncharacterized protein n=1 Tax=Conexibacter woesei (strain DSM 14684 / CCUG 47730 / CIP 108061 / JCM 11494 / NBRC 100937 / ID131577) TaxID=469383 RepID=D3F7F4_CONWI|nr:hypothetical protein [Conexibacter woesei]ADB50816.1 hypothetical protein Cwoe_2392 [Conexibacter woesei DSM 14684]
MSLEQLSKGLELDDSRLLATASATADYARRLAESDAGAIGGGAAAARDRTLLLASACTRAASLWMLIDAGRAAPLLEDAADLHDGAGTGYGDVLRICAAPRAAPRAASLRPLFEEDVWNAPPVAVLLNLLHGIATGAVPAELYGDLLRDLPFSRVQPWLPVGRLRIPLGSFLDLGGELAALRGGEAHADSERLPATGAFLRTVGEATGVAIADRHHWPTLRSGLLPVEPEAAATCALVESVVRDRLGGSLLDLLDISPYSRDAAPAVVARALVDRGAPGAGAG